MPTRPDRHTYTVKWSEEDEQYVGICAEYPSLSWLADTQGDALAGITVLVGDCVKDQAASEKREP